MTPHPPMRLAAASLAAVFALTACSPSAGFDFTETSMGPAGSIEFRVPDELIELEDDYAENRVFESITLTSVESESPSGCAVEYQFNYVTDGRDLLIEYLNDNPSDERSGEERMASILTGKSLDSIEIDDEDYTSAVVPVDCASSPTDDESTVRASFTWIGEDEDDEVGAYGFARAHVAVMRGDELHVQETEVQRDWELDTNGNWIR